MIKNIKNVNLILFIIQLVIMIGCDENRQSLDKLIKVDVLKTNYPKKELFLQDFMDVEYVALETKDSFFNQGIVLDISKNIILVKNRIKDGNIFIYDRAGKAIRKINRKGQSGEEYTSYSWVKLDEGNNKIYVNDHFSKKIIAYDLYGNFIRSFKEKDDCKSALPAQFSTQFYTDIFNYDKDNLICYDIFNKEVPFVLISKRDGSINKEIKIPFKEKKILMQVLIDDVNGQIKDLQGPGSLRSIIPNFNGNWILSEISSDTIFQLLPDYSLLPFITRTPTVESMVPEVVLVLRLVSERYIFMETIKNAYDFTAGKGFPRTFMMYDKQEKVIYNYTVYNGDFSTKKEIYMSMAEPINHEVESWYSLESPQLVEAYKKGELKGKLKEIAAKLNEESNPVIMLIKHKQ